MFASIVAPEQDDVQHSSMPEAPHLLAPVGSRRLTGPHNPHQWHRLPTCVAFCHQTMWEKCIILPSCMLRFAIATLFKC